MVDKMEDLKSMLADYFKAVNRYAAAQRNVPEQYSNMPREQKQMFKEEVEAASEAFIEKNNKENEIINIIDIDDKNKDQIFIIGVPFKKKPNYSGRTVTYQIFDPSDREFIPNIPQNLLYLAYKILRGEIDGERQKMEYKQFKINENISKKEESIENLMDERGLFTLIGKIIVKCLTKKNISQYRAWSDNKYKLNAKINSLLQNMKDNINVHGSFINLIDTLAKYKKENPTLQDNFTKLYTILTADDVLEFLIDGLHDLNVSENGRYSSLTATNYKSLIKLLDIVIENTKTLDEATKKSIQGDITALSKFNALENEGAKLSSNKLKRNNIKKSLNGKNTRKTYNRLVPEGMMSTTNNRTLKNKTVSIINPEIAGPNPTLPRTNGTIQGGTRKRSKRSKRIQTRRR